MHDKRGREMMTLPNVNDTERMNQIHRLLNGTEWDSDTMSQVAELVIASGRPIGDPTDADGTPTDGRLIYNG